ncbi:MAG: hypothetical protein ACREFK_07230, partial [Stellaceae bacterium]
VQVAATAAPLSPAQGCRSGRRHAGYAKLAPGMAEEAMERRDSIGKRGRNARAWHGSARWP